MYIERNVRRQESTDADIKLYTCGYMDMGCHKKYVYKALRKFCDVWPNYVVDASGFKNRAVDTVGKCTGEHVDILREMCKDKDNLNDTFYGIQNALYHWCNIRCRDGLPITIVVICPKGKHRSRALARILHYVISKSHDLKVTQPIHLSKGDCRSSACSQGCCLASGKYSVKKSAIFAKAYYRWQKLIGNG